MRPSATNELVASHMQQGSHEHTTAFTVVLYHSAQCFWQWLLWLWLLWLWLLLLCLSLGYSIQQLPGAAAHEVQCLHIAVACIVPLGELEEAVGADSSRVELGKGRLSCCFALRRAGRQ